MKAISFALLVFRLSAQDLTIESLAREVMRNKSAQDRDLTEFTYDYEYRYQYFDGKGKPGRKLVTTGETYQSSTRNLNVALTWNGAPDSPRKIEKKRLEAARKLQADYDQRLKRGPLDWGRAGDGPEYGTTVFGLRMEIFDVLRRCPLENLRTEQVEGRETFVFDYRPASNPTKDMPHLTQIRGTFWIDVRDRLVRRWDAVVASGPSAGHRLWQEDYHKVLNRIWVGKHIWLNLNASLPGWKTSARVEWDATFANHQRFGVEVDQKIETPPVPK